MELNEWFKPQIEKLLKSYIPSHPTGWAEEVLKIMLPFVVEASNDAYTAGRSDGRRLDGESNGQG